MYKEKSLSVLYGRCVCYLLIATHFFIVSGCATLPTGVPVSDAEQSAVTRDFLALVNSQQDCLEQIDADISVSFENLLQQGRINGSLLAMPPAYLRFNGLNPLGLTELVFATDCHRFTLVTVRKQMGYSGSLKAKKIQHYMPNGFQEDFIFLLTGVLPEAEKIKVRRVRKTKTGSGYWLDIAYHDSSKSMKILYRPGRQGIDQIIITSPESNDSLVVNYQYSADSFKNSCPDPQLIRLDSDGNGSVSIEFSKRYPIASLKKERFQVVIPTNYKQVTVQ